MTVAETGEKQAGRGARGRFAPGASGNPAGRPKGSRNRVTALCADMLAQAAPEVMETLIKRAKARKGGDMALKLVVERLIPARGARDRAVELDLAAGQTAADLVRAAAAVIEHAAAGDITLSEAREFVALLDVERRMIETSELSVRIEALERETAEAAAADPDARRVRVVEARRGAIEQLREAVERSKKL